MLELYLVSSVVCVVLILLMGKFIDGEVTVGDLIVSIIIGFIPFANICALVYGVITIWAEERLANRKLF